MLKKFLLITTLFFGFPVQAQQIAPLDKFADLLPAGQNFANEIGITNAIKRETEKGIASAVALLDRTGQRGALIRVDIAMTRSLDIVNRIIVGDHAVLVGAGSNWSAVAFGQDYIRPGAPDGYRLDPRSFMMWVYNGPDGQRYVRAISDAEYREMDAFRLIDSKFQAEAEAGKAIAVEDALLQLEDIALTSEQKAFIVEANQTIRKERDEIRAIDSALASELERQRRRANAHMVLSAVASFFSVAQSINSWAQETGESPTENMKNATTGAEVLQEAGMLRDYSMRQITGYRTSREGAYTRIRSVTIKSQDYLLLLPDYGLVPELLP